MNKVIILNNRPIGKPQFFGGTCKNLCLAKYL